MVQSTKKPYVTSDTVFKVASAITLPGVPKAWATTLDRNLDKLPQGELSLLYVHAVQPSFYALLNDEVKFSVRYHDGAYQAGAKFELRDHAAGGIVQVLGHLSHRALPRRRVG